MRSVSSRSAAATAGVDDRGGYSFRHTLPEEKALSIAARQQERDASRLWQRVFPAPDHPDNAST